MTSQEEDRVVRATGNDALRLKNDVLRQYLADLRAKVNSKQEQIRNLLSYVHARRIPSSSSSSLSATFLASQTADLIFQQKKGIEWVDQQGDCIRGTRESRILCYGSRKEQDHLTRSYFSLFPTAAAQSEKLPREPRRVRFVSCDAHLSQPGVPLAPTPEPCNVEGSSSSDGTVSTTIATSIVREKSLPQGGSKRSRSVTPVSRSPSIGLPVAPAATTLPPSSHRRPQRTTHRKAPVPRSRSAARVTSLPRRSRSAAAGGGVLAIPCGPTVLLE